MNDSTTADADAPALRRRWLVVDDEPELSDLIANLLAQMNHARIESFTSAPEALAAFAASPGHFDLVVTDRDMPGLDGLELARHLRDHAPAIKIILLTANIDDISNDDIRRAGVHVVIEKPFPIGRLEAIIQELVNEPTAIANWPVPSALEKAA